LIIESGIKIFAPERITSVLIQKFLHEFIEENPFEKGFFLKLLS